MQRAKYDIGEEAVHRFSLSAEDKATLELIEWVDCACGKPSVCLLLLILIFLIPLGLCSVYSCILLASFMDVQ